VADQLASPADLASLVQADVDTASATLAVEVATALVQSVVGQRLVQVLNDTEIVYGGTDRTLRLSQRPVTAVTSVTYGGVLLSEGTASGTWRLSPAGLWRDLGWTEYACDPSPVTVVYSHGYAPGAQELQLARGFTLALARGLFVNPSGVVREQIDDYQVAYAEAAAAVEASPGMAAALRRQYGRKAGLVRII
jgi:hypothetical protein